MPSAPLAVDGHKARAARHLLIGGALEDAGDEWAAVALFYAAYHLVKAALLSDPIFDDPAKLHAIHFDILGDDRHTSRHHGRKGGPERSWGINEMVTLLYPAITRSYERLHQASIDVRYSIGLPVGALPDLRAAIDQITQAADAGSLRRG